MPLVDALRKKFSIRGSVMWFSKSSSQHFIPAESVALLAEFICNAFSEVEYDFFVDYKAVRMHMVSLQVR